MPAEAGEFRPHRAHYDVIVMLQGKQSWRSGPTVYVWHREGS